MEKSEGNEREREKRDLGLWTCLWDWDLSERETRMKWASIWPELYFYITTCSFVKSLIHYAVKKIFFFFLMNQ